MKCDPRALLAPLLLLPLLLLSPAPAHAQAATAQGALVLDTVEGFSLEGNLTGDSTSRTVAVYLPPSYEEEGRAPLPRPLPPARDRGDAPGLGSRERGLVQPAGG